MKKKKTPARKKPLGPKKWAEISAFWALGEKSLGELSTLYGVSKEHISRKMKSMGVKLGEKAQEHAKEVQEEIKNGAVEDAKILAERIRASKDSHFKNADILGRLAMNILAEAKKANKPLAACDHDLRSIERASKIQENVLGQKWKLLGLDKDDPTADDLPELIIREMTEQETDEVRKRADENTAVATGDLSSLDVEAIEIDDSAGPLSDKPPGEGPSSDK